MRNVSGWWLPDYDKHFGTFAGKGGYQLDRQEMCWKYVKKWDVAIDCGAHVGFWTREMLERFKLVHAFEPIKDHRDCLEANTEGAAIHPFALGNKAQTVKMILNKDNTGGSYVSENGEGAFQMVTIDSFGFPTVDFIKMDVEDWESYVIEGAKQTLLRCKPILCVEQGHTNHGGRGFKAAQALLENMGMVQLDKIKDDYVFGW
jgi:FkbM family methyltransferase